MTDHVEIAIYAEHTASAGRMVPDPNSANPDDMQIFAGTPVELAELAREYCKLSGPSHQYHRKCSRVILDELYSTGAIERPIWHDCDCAHDWCDIANLVLIECGIPAWTFGKMHLPEGCSQIWYDCRYLNQEMTDQMVMMHDNDGLTDIPDWQDLTRQDIRVVAHRYRQSID